MSNVDWDRYGDELLGMNDEIKDLCKAIESYCHSFKDSNSGELDKDVEEFLDRELDKHGGSFGYSEWIEDVDKINSITIDVGRMMDMREIAMPITKVFGAVIDKLIYNDGIDCRKLFVLLLIDYICSAGKFYNK
tara:strand:+ start:285 stop:686 length:402 start_codon:yes stop_codon:yes gene_type:complete